MRSTLPSLAHRRQTTLEAVVLLAAGTLLAGFVAMRYGGLWGETDTSVFAAAIRAMLAEARLMPAGSVYVNGYGFPALGTFLIHATGLSVAQLQIGGGALLAVWLIIPAWLAYRELTGTARGATLATVLVLVQPEFLFTILRGTHEKFTRGLMFLCIYLLVRSIAARRRWQHAAGLLLAFYLASYALITFNNLLAFSFIVALSLSLVLSMTVRWLGGSARDDSTPTRRCLLYAVGTSLVLAFLFTFYAYPPARHGIRVLELLWDRVALLFLDVEFVAVNPYGTIATAWISTPVYLVVTLANWLLMGISFALWSTESLRWWRHRTWPEEPQAMLLWSLYGAFGFLGLVSIVVDISGAMSANLQHRIFPSFATIGAAVVAYGFLTHGFLTHGFLTHRKARRHSRRLSGWLLPAAITLLAVLALAKATNEPMLSNKWQHYSSAEFAAMDWARHKVPDGRTWAGFDERLSAAIGICCAWEAVGARFDAFQPAAVTRNVLLSDIIRARGERLNRALPVAGDSLRVYDNGAAEIYHLRPRTPFQR